MAIIAVPPADKRQDGPPGNGPRPSPPVLTPAATGTVGPLPAGWSYPALQNLIAGASAPADGEQDKEWLEQTETKTKSALQQFQLQAKLSQASSPPTAQF